MVYVPELDRQGFVDRQRINQERNRPTMSRKDAFLQGSSPEGRNYATMMDLMGQSPGFESGDPRIDQLKQARRQYNRQDKYNIGEIMGQTPQFMNELYRTNSGVLREYANPTYNAMYPISEMLHRTTGSGGITGMLLNKAFGKTKEAGRGFYQDLRDMGTDIMDAVGIAGALDPEEATQEVLDNYADQTFRPNIYDVTGPVQDEPGVFTPEELTREEKIQELIDEEQSKIDNFETDAYSDILDDAIENQWGEKEPIIGEKDTQEPVGNLISDELWESIGDFDPSTIGGGGELHAGEGIEVPDWLLDPSLPMPEELTEGEYLPGEYHDELISPADDYDKLPSLPPAYDDSAREAGIMQNMSPYSRNYVPPLEFPPRGPHDPFDPDQQVFENDEEYRAWLRRKRLGY